MAIQNFLSGGFYGKLGMVVGQRWKNKRTLRTYVIPHDPKTPLQTAQRRKFASNVVMSQCALMSNWKSNWFESEEMTSWNVRMTTAAELAKTETTFLSKLPLIPTNKEPPYPINRAKVTQDPNTHDVTIIIDCDIPQSKRNLSIYATNTPTTENPDDVLLLQAEGRLDRWKFYRIPNVEGFTFDTNTRFRIVSNDEKLSEIEAMLSNEMISDNTVNEVYDFPTVLTAMYVSGNSGMCAIKFPGTSGTWTMENWEIEGIVNGEKQWITPQNVQQGIHYVTGAEYCSVLTFDIPDTINSITFNPRCKMRATKARYYDAFNSLDYVSSNWETTLPEVTPIPDVFNAEIKQTYATASGLYFKTAETRGSQSWFMMNRDCKIEYYDQNLQKQIATVPKNQVQIFFDNLGGEETITVFIPFNWFETYRIKADCSVWFGEISTTRTMPAYTGWTKILNFVQGGAIIDLSSSLANVYAYSDDDSVTALYRLSVPGQSSLSDIQESSFSGTFDTVTVENGGSTKQTIPTSNGCYGEWYDEDNEYDFEMYWDLNAGSDWVIPIGDTVGFTCTSVFTFDVKDRYNKKPLWALGYSGRAEITMDEP